MIIALLDVTIISLRSVTGQTGSKPADVRGQGVKIKVEGGQTIDLYSGSYALVIGAADYQYWRKLPGVIGDVEEVATVLRKHDFSVETLLNPTRSSLDGRIMKFISDHGQAPNNRLLIYFAGHGHTLATIDKRSLGYIVPIDAPLPTSSEFKRFAISMSQVADVYATEIESKHALFVFDSCFSGSVFATRAAGASPPAIARNTAEPVRQFITAGSENEVVPDRSIFRDYFVLGLEGEADLNKDKYVTGSELGLYLEHKVTNDRKSSQKPQWGKVSPRALNRGDFVFRVPVSSRIPVTETPLGRAMIERNRRRNIALTTPLYIYGVRPDGQLVWYRHDGVRRLDNQGKVVGYGWNIYSHIFSAGKGIIYAITSDGEMRWYRHGGYREGGGLETWEPQDTGYRKVGVGWQDMRHVFWGGEGVIYAVNANGELLWYKHNGYQTGGGLDTWEGHYVVGRNWANMSQVFSAGEGRIYAFTRIGQLRSYKHEGYRDGVGLVNGDGKQSQNPRFGMEGTQRVFWGGETFDYGLVYTITTKGDLRLYKPWSEDMGIGIVDWPSESIAVGAGWGDLKHVFAMTEVTRQM